MKNLKSLIVFATLLLLASCSKEPMFQTEDVLESSSVVETVDDISLQSKNQKIDNTASANGTSIPVSEISNSASLGELVVDFRSRYNFDGKGLEKTQTLDFTDGGGHVITLTFQVSTSSSLTGGVQVSYLIGGNDLSGLTIIVAQQIVIEDSVII